MKILVIEDDTGICELISLRLIRMGCEPRCVHSASDALSYLAGNSPDLMILDYSLPDMNAGELVDTLRKKNTQLPPFIISTGEGDERIIEKMMGMGAADIIIKDLDFLDLMPEIVKKHFRQIR